MKKVLLGNSGVDVSMFCLGTMYFGSRNNKETSYQILDQYVKAGGSFLDTANIYAWWVPGYAGDESETLLGEWMRERKNRDQLFIASKVGFHYQDVKHGLKAQQIEEECHKSLKRMGIEMIDLYYAHVDDRNTPMEETLEAFDRLVKAGKVRLTGASNFLAWRLEEARWMSQTHGWAEYCCIQQRYTYIRPRSGTNFEPQVAANDDLLDYCRARDITMLAYSPLLSGAYSRAERSFQQQYVGSDTDKRLAALKKVADELGATVNQIVLAWMVHSDPYVIPLVAASTEEQMEENLGALDIKLSAEQMEYLNKA